LAKKGGIYFTRSIEMGSTTTYVAYSFPVPPASLKYKRAWPFGDVVSPLSNTKSIYSPSYDYTPIIDYEAFTAYEGRVGYTCPSS
jgi:hypothetical protein